MDTKTQTAERIAANRAQDAKPNGVGIFLALTADEVEQLKAAGAFDGSGVWVDDNKSYIVQRVGRKAHLFIDPVGLTFKRIKVIEGITRGQADALVEAIEQVADEDYDTTITTPAGEGHSLWIGYAGTPDLAAERIANILAQALLLATGAA